MTSLKILVGPSIVSSGTGVTQETPPVCYRPVSVRTFGDPMEPVRVLLVSDDALARTGLASLLATQEGISVIARLGTGEDFGLAARETVADVAVCDLGAGARRDLDRIAELRRAGLPVVALASDAAEAREAWAAGARGVLFRDREATGLAAGVWAVSRGLTVLEPEVVEPGRRLRSPAATAPVEPLTARELEVLQLLSEGLSNKAIAGRLDISDHTAKFHVNAILGKLGVQSRTEALVQAARLGLVVL